MLIGYFALKGDYPGRAALTWSDLPSEIDKAQDWLLEQRTAENPNIFFAILDGFRAFADWLVTALLNFFEWLTWSARSPPARCSCGASAAGAPG